MEHIRLGVYGLSQFATDIVKTLVSDLAFVRFVELPEPSGDLQRDFADSGADVLVCSFPADELDRLWHAALEERPPLAVLNLVDDCARGRVYAQYPHGHAVEDVTQETLRLELERHLRSLQGHGGS
jgi:hypothetical protein